jgi:hypothetical protein
MTMVPFRALAIGTLAEYFQTLARRYTPHANADGTIARSHRGTRIAQAAAHCDRIVAASREAAEAATAAAEMHTQSANLARRSAKGPGRPGRE